MTNMINLEIPDEVEALVSQAHQVAAEIFRPISRKYDPAEHEYPKELDMLAAVIDGMNEGGELGGAGAGAVGASRPRTPAQRTARNRNGGNMASLLRLIELCWGDVGLMLVDALPGPRQAAIAAVATEEQLERFGGKWAAMAITEPEAGSDSAAIRTTASSTATSTCSTARRSSSPPASAPSYRRVGDAGSQPGPRRDQVVRRRARQPRPEARPPRAQARHPRLRHRRLRAQDCRIPKENLLGSPEIEPSKGFAGVMQTFDNTRPLVAAMAVGVARACLERHARALDEAGVEIDYDTPAHAPDRRRRRVPAMEADWEAARLLTLQAAWMADNSKPNSLQASMAKAKAGRTGTDVALRCVELCGAARLRRERAAREVGPRRRRSSTSSRAPSRSSC